MDGGDVGHSPAIPQMDGAEQEIANDMDDAYSNISDNEDDLEINENCEKYDDDQCAAFLLTNARLLINRMGALADAIDSLKVDVACVTETWFKGGKKLQEGLGRLQGERGVKVLHRSRDGRRKSAGGGVAIAFNSTTCNFKQRQLGAACRQHEFVCAVGKVQKIPKKIAVFAVYIPPNLRVAEVGDVFRGLSEEIVAVKTALGDPGGLQQEGCFKRNW